MRFILALLYILAFMAPAQARDSRVGMFRTSPIYRARIRMSQWRLCSIQT